MTKNLSSASGYWEHQIDLAFTAFAAATGSEKWVAFGKAARVATAAYDTLGLRADHARGNIVPRIVTAAQHVNRVMNTMRAELGLPLECPPYMSAAEWAGQGETHV